MINNEEIDIYGSEISEPEEHETEFFSDKENEKENQEVFQIEVEPETEIEIYSELTSEPLIVDETVEVLETEITDSTVTTIDYIAETYKNTKTSAECLSFLSGALIIISAILICVAITKVLIGY